ncbi:MAG: iron-containing alcohol dehydrogenase [Peptostreptococcaceae bacterium]|jgi:NADP-dependent alcohol dehydrogenase|nr:iron-containing alcohol dehydrogenase [Peptostreptococcaceae bacterium]
MFSFNIYNPTRIVFGKDKISQIDKLIPKDAKVLITYGGGSVKKYKTLDKVKEALGDRIHFEFGGIEPNPKYDTLMKALDIVNKENINCLLAVGGGSVIDGTKFIKLAANYDGEPKELLTKGGSHKVKENKNINIATVLTLPATGSEMNSGAVVTCDEGKFAVNNPMCFPMFSILDPTLTYTLPETQVANGIVDTFVHVNEQYLTYPVDARFQDRTSEGILRTLIEIGQDTIKNPTNYDLRANLMLCATMGLNGLIGSGVPQDWTSHMIGHELTALFGLDHGKTLAIVMPSLFEVKKDAKRDKLIQYGKRVFDIESTDDNEIIDLAISKTREFFESLGIKTRLSDYGIKKEQIDLVIEQLKNHNFTSLGENRDIDLETSRKILENAL